MTARRLLVTGTDTGVGKTFVTAALAAALTARGVRIAVAKPVETGCRLVDGELYAEDAATLRAAASLDVPIERVCPYRFADPLAPAVAAARAGSRIDADALVATLDDAARDVELLVIEGAGGLLVPIADRFSYADLAAALSAAVIVVVGSRLGALNHALLTIDALAARAIPVHGYVVNRLAPPGDLAVDTNTEALAALAPAPRLGDVPWHPEAAALLAALRAGGEAAVRARARASTVATRHLDLATIL